MDFLHHSTILNNDRDDHSHLFINVIKDGILRLIRTPISGLQVITPAIRHSIRSRKLQSSVDCTSEALPRTGIKHRLTPIATATMALIDVGCLTSEQTEIRAFFFIILRNCYTMSSSSQRLTERVILGLMTYGKFTVVQASQRKSYLRNIRSG